MTADPTGPVSFDRIAHRYDETRGGPKRGAEMVDDLTPWLAPGSILEVGVGTGLVSAALAESGRAALGIDISPLMAGQAYARLGPRVAVGDARHLPVGDASVDNVLFVWALHLVGDAAAALAEAARVIRGGGRVVAVHGGPTPARVDMADAMAPLDNLPGRLRTRPDTDDALATAGSGAGLTRIHNGWTKPYSNARTPNQVAEQIESRVWSFLWRLDDDVWQSHALPAVAALRALPEPNRPRTIVARHRISVFTV